MRACVTSVTACMTRIQAAKQARVVLQGGPRASRLAPAQSLIGHAQAPCAMACCGDYIITASEAILVWRLHPEAGLSDAGSTQRHRVQTTGAGKHLATTSEGSTALVHGPERQPEALPEAEVRLQMPQPASHL